MNIAILNLPRDIEEKKLAEIFKPYGRVGKCTIIMDKVTGASKGFGFVEMDDEAEATAAITALHGSNLGKNRIRVKVSKDMV